jgi:hypothetical protein
MNLVPTPCRARLQPRDFEFISATLAGSAEERGFLVSLFEEPAALDAILENDRLFRAVMELPMPLSISPELYFFVLVRRSLKEAGIDDLEIADYVAATLADQSGGALGSHPSGRAPDADFTYHVDIIERMNEASPSERFFSRCNAATVSSSSPGSFPDSSNDVPSAAAPPGLDITTASPATPSAPQVNIPSRRSMPCARSMDVSANVSLKPAAPSTAWPTSVFSSDPETRDQRSSSRIRVRASWESRWESSRARPR